MNVLLKAVIVELMDLVQAGEDVAGKQWSALISAVLKAGMDLPAVISNIGDAMPELQALLKDPAADADLSAFVVAQVGGQTKAAAIISAAADVLISAAMLEPKVVVLINAIKA